MKKKILKKILHTKIGDLIFKIMVMPPILGFSLIGGAIIWWSAER